jgi:hypothetical protein
LKRLCGGEQIGGKHNRDGGAAVVAPLVFGPRRPLLLFSLSPPSLPPGVLGAALSSSSGWRFSEGRCSPWFFYHSLLSSMFDPESSE